MNLYSQIKGILKPTKEDPGRNYTDTQRVFINVYIKRCQVIQKLPCPDDEREFTEINCKFIETYSNFSTNKKCLHQQIF